MFLKQYNYKPRTGSVSSDSGSGSQAQTTTQQPAPTGSPRRSIDQNSNVSAAIAGRRRSSVDQKFAGLHNYKRSSVDEKRASFAEQHKNEAGVLGTMWNNFTKGSK